MAKRQKDQLRKQPKKKERQPFGGATPNSVFAGAAQPEQGKRKNR